MKLDNYRRGQALGTARRDHKNKDYGSRWFPDTRMHNIYLNEIKRLKKAEEDERKTENAL